MSGSFGAQTQALATAASAFQSQADPILQQAQRLETITGTGQTTGRDYSAQGDAYHQVITGPLNAVVRSFGETCLTVSSGLTANQQNYEGADASGSTALRSAGGEGR
jgi:hypothetical protein